MANFEFVTYQEDSIDFDDGTRVILKHRMTGGDRLTLMGIMANEQMNVADGVRAMLRMNLLRVIAPDGTETKFTPELIDRLDPETMEVLINEVNRRNPPLAPEAPTGPSTTGPSANPRKSPTTQ